MWKVPLILGFLSTSLYSKCAFATDGELKPWEPEGTVD